MRLASLGGLDTLPMRVCYAPVAVLGFMADPTLDAL